MKTLIKKLMIIGIWLVAVVLGCYIESQMHFFNKPVPNGMAKTEIPAVGSAMHVEYVSPDKTEFLAVYAGTRLFYKTPVTSEKTMVRLDSEASYEVVDQKTTIAGGHGKSLAKIN